MKTKQKKEREFYEKIKTVLQTIFGSYVEERPMMGAPSSYKENPYLEITAWGFSATLEREFSDKTLRFLRVETSLPDIMGFVQKKPSSKKELITVEVKRIPINLFHILKAKFYQDIFGAKFGLLISTKGIIERKVRFVLNTEIGKAIRGKIIIAKFTDIPYGYGYGTVGSLQINPKFETSVPEPFKRFCESSP